MKKILIALLTSLAFSFNLFAAVNINTATQQELESLDGIGEVKAKAIIDYRKKNGGFKSIDELEKVDGVGSTTLKNLRKEVAVSGKTTVIAPAKKDTSLVKAAKSKTGDVKAKQAKTASKAKTEAAKKAKPAKEASLVKSAESKTGDAKTTKVKKADTAKTKQ
ncbi:MAG: ComEA family DNA-binding protein [Pseudomonadota bacterium]